MPGTSPRTKPGLHHTAGHSPVQSHYPGTSPDAPRRPLEAPLQEYRDLALRLTINTPLPPLPLCELVHTRSASPAPPRNSRRQASRRPSPPRAPLPRRRVRRGCADPAPPAGPSGAAGSGQPLGTLRSPPRPRDGANRAGERVPPLLVLEPGGGVVPTDITDIFRASRGGTILVHPQGVKGAGSTDPWPFYSFCLLPRSFASPPAGGT